MLTCIQEVGRFRVPYTQCPIWSHMLASILQFEVCKLAIDHSLCLPYALEVVLKHGEKLLVVEVPRFQFAAFDWGMNSWNQDLFLSFPSATLSLIGKPLPLRILPLISDLFLENLVLRAGFCLTYCTCARLGHEDSQRHRHKYGCCRCISSPRSELCQVDSRHSPARRSGRHSLGVRHIWSPAECIVWSRRGTRPCCNLK